ATKAPGKQRLSDPKSPRQGHRHCLSEASPTAPASLSELLTKRVLLPRTKCRCRSTPSRRITRRVHKMLAAARLSLKLVLSRTKPNHAPSTLTSVLKAI